MFLAYIFFTWKDLSEAVMTWIFLWDIIDGPQGSECIATSPVDNIQMLLTLFSLIARLER